MADQMEMKWKKLLSSKRTSDKSHSADLNEDRTRFEQDYDRIIFSHPFRRLQDKTQVFPLPEDDFVHNRLTHSLEVSSVGRSLGKKVGQVILKQEPKLAEHGYTMHDFGAIVAAACLAHDVGNPPYGHSGEDGISGFFSSTEAGRFFEDKVTSAEWKDLTNFEGNAQGFRILNDSRYGGLRLTFATLATFTKYPLSCDSKKDPNRKSHKKYGYTQSETSLFERIAEETGLISLGNGTWTRHPLSFLVEAADDICYTIIDLEDATRLGLVPIEKTRELLSSIIGSAYNEDRLLSIPDLNEQLALLRAMAIGRLITACQEVFLNNEKDILCGTFDKSLLSQTPFHTAVKDIISLSVEKIYRSTQVIQREAVGFEVMEKLMHTFCLASYHKFFDQSMYSPRHQSMYQLLPQDVRVLLEAEDHSVYQTLQMVIDFLSGMTDKSALKLHRIITGQIPVF